MTQPPPEPGGYPPTAGGLPREAYTSWLHRVLAFVVDLIPVAVLEAIGFGLLLGTQETACATEVSEYDLGAFCATGASTLGQVSFVVTWILAAVYLIWNYGYQQGTTGSSIGKSLLKFKVVSEKTHLPVGFGMSIVRQLAHAVDAVICYIGFLFPLWDAKRQTLADKIIKTICLPR